MEPGRQRSPERRRTAVAPPVNDIARDLRQLVAELEAVAGDGVPLEIRHDARIAVEGRPQPVKVDILVRYQQGEAVRTCLVAVQKPGRQVDQPFVAALERKALSLSADRATVLTDSGFTHDAAKRVERSQTLGGVRTMKPNLALWPVDPSGILATIGRKDAPAEAVVLVPAAVLTRLGSTEQLLVLLGTGEATDCALAAVLPRKPDERGNHQVSLWVLRGDEPFRDGTATIRVTMPDGSPRMLMPGAVERVPPPPGRLVVP